MTVTAVRERIEGSAAPVIRLDVAAVTFIDSTGLAGLLDAMATIEGEGRRLELANCSPAVTRLLEITALTDRFAAAADGAPDPHSTQEG